jgi:hypothetical protein
MTSYVSVVSLTKFHGPAPDYELALVVILKCNYFRVVSWLHICLELICSLGRNVALRTKAMYKLAPKLFL